MLQTRGCDGTNNYDKQAKNTSKPSNDSSSSSTTESPDSTDYASDEYLCLPEPKVRQKFAFKIRKIKIFIY